MIAYLEGLLKEKKPDFVILLASGVGYGLHIPASTFYKLPQTGQKCSFYVHTHVREDQLTLYGFSSREELDVFKALISVRGFGPRLAITVLSGMEPQALIHSISGGDIMGLSSIPGIGKKTAERLIYELREKLHRYIEMESIADTDTWSTHIKRETCDDLISAMTNLGYPRNAAERVSKEVIKESPDEPFEVLLKRALKRMMSK